MAAQRGQTQISVHIFPCRLTDGKLEALIGKNLLHRFFWENLLPVYEYFEKTHRIPVLEVETSGRYRIKE